MIDGIYLICGVMHHKFAVKIENLCRTNKVLVKMYSFLRKMVTFSDELKILRNNDTTNRLQN